MAGTEQASIEAFLFSLSCRTLTRKQLMTGVSQEIASVDAVMPWMGSDAYKDVVVVHMKCKMVLLNTMPPVSLPSFVPTALSIAHILLLSINCSAPSRKETFENDFYPCHTPYDNTLTECHCERTVETLHDEIWHNGIHDKHTQCADSSRTGCVVLHDTSSSIFLNIIDSGERYIICMKGPTSVAGFLHGQ